MDVEVLRNMLPKRFRGYMTDDLYSKVEEFYKGDSKDYWDNFMSYLGVLKESGCTLSAYSDAVRYCSYRLLGESKVESYKRAFPDRVEKFIRLYGGDEELLGKKIRQNADAYNRNKIVCEVIGQSLVPNWIVNAGYNQEALNKLVEIIRDDSIKNGMVKVKACEAILEATKRPEVIEQRIRIEGSSGLNEEMEELREITERLSKGLREEIERGKGLKEVSEIELVKREGGVYEERG